MEKVPSDPMLIFLIENRLLVSFFAVAPICTADYFTSIWVNQAFIFPRTRSELFFLDIFGKKKVEETKLQGSIKEIEEAKHQHLFKELLVK